MSRRQQLLDTLKSGQWHDLILRASRAGTATRWAGSPGRSCSPGCSVPWPSTWPTAGADEEGSSEFNNWADSLWGVWVLLFSGLDQPPEDGGRSVDRHGPAGGRGSARRGYSRRAWPRSRRTLSAEARRVQLRDGRPPGPVQLVPARPGVDPRGPRQDHPGQAAGRHHPRRPRRDRPSRQAGRRRPSATSTSSRATRPARSSCAGPRSQGPLGGRARRRPRGQARRRQVASSPASPSGTSAAATSSPTSRPSAATPPIAIT